MAGGEGGMKKVTLHAQGLEFKCLNPARVGRGNRFLRGRRPLSSVCPEVCIHIYTHK